MATLIEAKDLRKRFGTIHAVDGVSLNVSAGEVLGFLGPNGAGKSTTMRMLTGFLEADSGSVQLAGIALDVDPLEARRRMGYLPEGAPAYPDMKVRDFLMFIAQARGFLGSEARRRVDEAVDRFMCNRFLARPLRPCLTVSSVGSDWPKPFCMTHRF